MLFPTVEFALFFPVVLALSWLLMPRQQLWKPFIVVASYVFYGYASWRFCLLLGAVTVVNQAAAVLISRTSGERARSWILGAAVAWDLGVLGVFKYYGFFVENWDRALGPFSLPVPLLTIALPVGVSFFTFQAISYVVDVKRRLVEPASTLDVAIYLSFFPHLVAGPIVRAREFLPQLQAPRDPTRVAVGSGIALIALGLVKKLAIADTLARTVVDPVFAVPGAYSGPDLWLAAYAYTAQIYCDFSGYTDMAIGLALLLGYVFPQNFRSPYRATGFSDFWRRWHMTLSRFLRDFLYIPLGGNRKGRWKTYRNLMLTMVLGGLWHGAAWPFVLWGFFHGTCLCIEHAWHGRVKFPAWLRWFVTFHLVVFGWILFRSTSLEAAGEFFAGLVQPGSATLFTLPVALMILVVIGLQLLPERGVERVQVRIERLQPVVLGVGLAVVIALVAATVSSQGVAPFIYFRFKTMPSDDSLMNRFDRNGLRRFRARDGVIALLVCAAVLVVFKGDSLERQGERMDPGFTRDVVLAVGHPAADVADALPFARATDDATAFLSPDDQLSADGGFATVAAGTGAEVPPVTPDAFEPQALGEKPPARKALKTLLVTGDSMVQPLDAKLAGALADRGVKVTREAKLGTGISKTFLVDWGQLSTQQVKKVKPDAVVVFIGANEGFPMKGAGGREVDCCGADWAALYANRARRMAATYRQNGRAKVYWITVPVARAANRAPITRTVNASVRVAVQPWASQVRVIDTNPIFAPKGYRDSMTVGGRDRIVRAPDGIHLNDAGAGVLSETVLARLREDFTY